MAPATRMPTKLHRRETTKERRVMRASSLLAATLPRQSGAGSQESQDAVVQSVSARKIDVVVVLKAFFNWCMARNLAASNPVRRVKFFNEDNSRLRYLTEDEYNRLWDAP